LGPVSFEEEGAMTDVEDMHPKEHAASRAEEDQASGDGEGVGYMELMKKEMEDVEKRRKEMGCEQRGKGKEKRMSIADAKDDVFVDDTAAEGESSRSGSNGKWSPNHTGEQRRGRR
jgi:hypothetical protein